jgi:hypothetical protein
MPRYFTVSDCGMAAWFMRTGGQVYFFNVKVMCTDFASLIEILT